MKRVFLPVLIGLVLAQSLVAQTNTYVWKGTDLFTETNNPPPQIDALNFVVANGATFGVDMALEQEYSTFPYTTSDTLNVTNFGLMVGFPGFDFEYYPVNPPPPQPGVPFSNMAGTFANIADGLGGGAIECESLFVVPPAEIDETSLAGLATVKVNATNIIDSGSVLMDNDGLIDFSGKDLDLRRGVFTMTPFFAQFGIFDWGSGGFGINSSGWFPGLELLQTTAQSADPFTNAPAFGRLLETMILTNSTPYFQSATGEATGPTTIVWRGVFLQDSSPANVAHNVYFGASDAGAGDFHIEWIGTNTDPVTGVPSPTFLYLSDDPAARRPTNYNFTLPPIQPINPHGDFTITESAVQLPSGVPATSSLDNQLPIAVTNDFSYINLQLSGPSVTNEVDGGSVTNVPGRIQLSASQTLKLENTRISGPSYTLISSPVDFEGNTNALISTAFADLNLGVTNGSLTLSNLLNPNVPVWTGAPSPPAPNAVLPGVFAMGGIQAWSGSFFYYTTNGTVTITNDVRILLINSAVQPSGPAFQQNVQLHAPDKLVVSDDLNIFGSFSSDTQALTIATNGTGAFSPFGDLNLLSDQIFWSTSLPNLQYLTNSGIVSTLNETIFAGNISSPYSDLNSATPYEAFINYGDITNEGTFIRADSFQNSGVIADPAGGSIDIASSGDAIATNGLFLAPEGYVSISADSLIASNGVIDAGGGPLTLTTPCSLSDGYVFGNQFAHTTNAIYPYVVTNGNTWIASGGVRIPVKPPTADLLGTTITNIAFNNSGLPIVNIWAGNDLGCTPQGFADNLALGRMILDADSTSEFVFEGANGSNALYVDCIELEGNTTNIDAHGNPRSIVIQPGMKIYYAQALQNGASVAELLNGKDGGGFCWVSNYAGVYSSTNILYPDDNTYIFNEALVISPDINSGGPQGTNTSPEDPNIDQKFPIPTNVLYDIAITGPLPCGTGGTGTNNPSTNAPSTNAVVLAHLIFPPESPASIGAGGSNTPVSFPLAAGSYNGLFYNSAAVAPSSSGYFSATVTSKGGYSAKLQIGSHDYSFSGTFNSSGAATKNDVSAKGVLPVNVNLQLVNNNQITGSVSSISGNGWTAQLQADRAAFTSKNPTPAAGKDILLLASDGQNSTTNTGEGFGAATISTAGAVQWNGTLPDGLKMTQKSALSRSNVWPVYSSLYGGKGLFIGWMQCTNQMDVSGTAVWEMPSGSGGLYPSGCTNQIDVTGSRLQGSVKRTCAAVLSGAGLETPLTNQVSVNPQTGLFSGTVTDGSNQKLSFQGALLEQSGIGGGFFLNAGQSGKVYLGPAN